MCCSIALRAFIAVDAKVPSCGDMIESCHSATSLAYVAFVRTFGVFRADRVQR